MIRCPGGEERIIKLETLQCWEEANEARSWWAGGFDTPTVCAVQQCGWVSAEPHRTGPQNN